MGKHLIVCLSVLLGSLTAAHALELKDLPVSYPIHGKDIDERNTGIPHKRPLTVIGEKLVITEEWIKKENKGKRVLEDKRFVTGSYLSIKVSDFTVRSCKFEGTAGVFLGTPVKGILIQDSEFDGNQENLGSKQAIKNDHAQLTLLRLHVHHWPRALTVTRGETLVINCYLHDLTADGVKEAHKENIYVAGGENQAYVGNRIIGNASRINEDITVLSISAALAIYNQGGGLPDLKNILIANNYFDGECSYTLYCGAAKGKKGKFATGMTVTGNVFSRSYNRKSGLYGPATSFNGSDQSNSWKENLWGERGGFWVTGDPDEGDTVAVPGNR